MRHPIIPAALALWGPGRLCFLLACGHLGHAAVPAAGIMAMAHILSTFQITAHINSRIEMSGRSAIVRGASLKFLRSGMCCHKRQCFSKPMIPEFLVQWHNPSSTLRSPELESSGNA